MIKAADPNGTCAAWPNRNASQRGGFDSRQWPYGAFPVTPLCKLSRHRSKPKVSSRVNAKREYHLFWHTIVPTDHAEDSLTNTRDPAAGSADPYVALFVFEPTRD